jgi:hypothetical protein
MPQPPAASAAEMAARLIPTAKIAAKNFVTFNLPYIEIAPREHPACGSGHYNLEFVKNRRRCDPDHGHEWRLAHR